MGEPQKAGFSLSLAGAKKPSKKVYIHDKNACVHKEVVLGFGEGGLETAEPKHKAKGGPLVIPKLENTYRYGRSQWKGERVTLLLQAARAALPATHHTE